MNAQTVMGTRSQLPTQLLDLRERANISLMATSRPDPTVEEAFLGFPTLEIRAIDGDVKQYVAGQMGRLPYCVRSDRQLQMDIRRTIAQAVDGMFLLARFHVDSLQRHDNKKAIQVALKNIHQGSDKNSLYNAYDEAMNRIENQLPEKCSRAKSALSWIAHAKRLLTAGELSHALRYIEIRRR